MIPARPAGDTKSYARDDVIVPRTMTTSTMLPQRTEYKFNSTLNPTAANFVPAISQTASENAIILSQNPQFEISTLDLNSNILATRADNNIALSHQTIATPIAPPRLHKPRKLNQHSALIQMQLMW